MPKTFPGRLLQDYDPALAERGNAYVGTGDVGLNVVDITVMVNTSGNHVALHSLLVAPSYWDIKPHVESLNAFIAFPGVTAVNSSAVYYTAHGPWTTVGASAVARRGRLYAWR